MNSSLLLTLLGLMGAATIPTYSCVPALDGQGWECFEGRRAPARALVIREQRPLVDNPWQTPALSPMRPDTILPPAEWFRWQPDFSQPRAASGDEASERQRPRQGAASRQVSAASDPTGYWLQLAAVRHPRSITAITDHRGLAEEPLHVSRDARSGLWLLLAGPFQRLSEAESLQQRLVEHIPDAYIRTRPSDPPIPLDQWSERHAE